MMECDEEKNKQTVALSIPMEEILSMAETKVEKDSSSSILVVDVMPPE
jgi:hypothetical protein